MLNGPFLVVFVGFIFAATFVGWARDHDRQLEQPEYVDYDALADATDQRANDDADAWRKGDR
ncbi:hypothetical protein ARZXY2_2483 [Arthrobacter sp. ZXY-2]|nr:hypothetical protein ARZXY2_2483 [Arthrobacter sp. ZXY-2]